MTGEGARELATTRAVDALPAGAWRALHDVRFPARRLATVDHLVVGRAGVFVVDSRDWTGAIDVDSNVLTQDGSSRDATVDRVADSGKALTQLVPELDPQYVVPVLCFDRDEPITGWAGEVLVCTAGNLVDVFTSQRRVWDAARAKRVFDGLTWALPPDWYRIGEPSGPPRSGHRLDGPARKSWVPWRRSSAKHV